MSIEKEHRNTLSSYVNTKFFFSKKIHLKASCKLWVKASFNDSKVYYRNYRDRYSILNNYFISLKINFKTGSKQSMNSNEHFLRVGYNSRRRNEHLRISYISSTSLSKKKKMQRGLCRPKKRVSLQQKQNMQL